MSRASVRKAVANQQYAQKNDKLGSGGRFAALKKAIAAKGGAEDPGAIAAKIGMEKYGKRKFSRLAVAARNK